MQSKIKNMENKTVEMEIQMKMQMKMEMDTASDLSAINN